jgi:hypothetical protein
MTPELLTSYFGDVPYGTIATIISDRRANICIQDGELGSEIIDSVWMRIPAPANWMRLNNMVHFIPEHRQDQDASPVLTGGARQYDYSPERQGYRNFAGLLSASVGPTGEQPPRWQRWQIPALEGITREFMQDIYYDRIQTSEAQNGSENSNDGETE